MNIKIAHLVLLLTAIALAGVPEAWKRDKAAFEANSRVLPPTRYRRCLKEEES